MYGLILSNNDGHKNMIDGSFYKLQRTYLIFIYLPMHLENWKLAFFNLSFCCVL